MSMYLADYGSYYRGVQESRGRDEDTSSNRPRVRIRVEGGVMTRVATEAGAVVRFRCGTGRGRMIKGRE